MRKIEINFEAKEIIISKKFSKAAKWFGSNEYYRLLDAMRNHPTFSVVIRKNHNVNEGLTYAFMKDYVEEHDRGGDDIFDFQYVLDEALVATNALNNGSAYNIVKKYFLERYPEALEELAYKNNSVIERYS